MVKSILLSKEDFWAIWIGLFILLFGIVIYFFSIPSEKLIEGRRLQQVAKQTSDTPFKSVKQWIAEDERKSIKGYKEELPAWFYRLTGKPGKWKANPIESFYLSEKNASVKRNNEAVNESSTSELEKRFKKIAIDAEFVAAERRFSVDSLNARAETAIASWRVINDKLESVKKKANVKSYNRFPFMILLMLIVGILFGIGVKVMDGKMLPFLKGFAFVFFIGVVSYWIEGQSSVKALGLSYAIWAIAIGLIISNTIGLPDWVKPALRTEFYIKTGLVLLGAEILMGKIAAIGLPGIFVAWVVTPIVLVSTFWFGQKILKISSKTLNMTISADMSVCGVSAAVATAAACKATKEELTLAVGLSMIFTSIMMVVLPTFINAIGMPEVLGGAWIGGTIDATGAVVAAGAFLGDTALSVAATIKMIQNVLIGLIAFGVAIYFTKRVHKADHVEVGWGEVWRRFPKFILGFIGASILFSVLYEAIGSADAYTLIDQGVIFGFTKNVRGWLFCLAFVSIGLSTRFIDFKPYFQGGKPLILYVVGQSFNLFFTLLMAYIMFYLVFPHITEAI
jgi:uncharacterized membrane protein YadS